ncbi:hypothetical protein OPV22_018868 [Ensete ventricosum]|uniref:BHLH domain-containing protein n=1 Tax=Ensete ventricosum TaxID=4639 RepID=A0AAV8QZK9_ENSVE|nr:hypothetical protein OPV22_018868 [Ensete ventricosum]
MAAQSSASSTLPKNIMAERERRNKFNKTLYDLRSVVPIITKMSKTAIILDAINYIQEQEMSLVDEVSELESKKQITAPPHGKKDEDLLHAQMQRRRAASMSSMVVMEVSVAEMGDGVSFVSITCNKKRDAIVMVFEVQQLSEGGLIVPVEGTGRTQELVNPDGSGIGGIVGDRRGRRRRRRRRRSVLKP